MTNYWKHLGIPQKGWMLVDVVDIREDGQTACETEYETCMMCGNEKIRYVHIVKHVEVGEEFRVGCSCAEKMTNDYVNPKQRESQLKNRASRRINWMKKNWKVSKNGNLFLKIEGRLLLIYQDKKSNKYKVKIGEQFGTKSFDTLELAKIAAFNGIEYFKEEGTW
jgi:hypothetical protein